MDNKLLGEQITRYRKERNMTQEELGRAAGVSTQAVSRWENGGAPDVALLPAIADKLGVTIDALFGREVGERMDIHDVVAKWISTVPEKDRFDQLCRLNWTAFKHLTVGRGLMPDVGYMDKAEIYDDTRDWTMLMSCQAWLDGGFMLDVHGEDISFASVWPRPEAGYEAYFAPREEYRKFFSLLSRPGCLEILEYLHSRSWRMYVPGTIAKALGMPIEEISGILAELTEMRALRKMDLQLEDGMSCAYASHNGVELVPLLYMARCMMQYGGHLLTIGGTENPTLLEGKEWKEDKEKCSETK